MSAFVEHVFQKGFILNEERLRKLREIIEKRTSPDLLSYKVFRGDSYSYVTQSIDDVAKEDNEDWKRITRLELLVGDVGARLSFSLIFSPKGCELRITGENRDEVFLLFSDLKDYVQNEITRSYGRRIQDFSKILQTLVTLAVALTFLYVMAYWTRHDPRALEDALRSTDSQAKLNYLLRDVARRDMPTSAVWTMVVFFVLTTAISAGLPQKLIRNLFPTNEFLFGKRKQNFEKRQRLVNNLLWIVVIGMIVSVVAGLIVWRLTGSH